MLLFSGVAASSRIVSKMSRTAAQWYSSHFPNVQVLILESSSSSSCLVQAHNLLISAWHSGGISEELFLKRDLSIFIVRLLRNAAGSRSSSSERGLRSCWFSQSEEVTNTSDG